MARHCAHLVPLLALLLGCDGEGGKDCAGAGCMGGDTAGPYETGVPDDTGLICDTGVGDGNDPTCEDPCGSDVGEVADYVYAVADGAYRPAAIKEGMAIGAPGGFGAVYTWRGPVDGAVSLDASARILQGDVEGGGFGQAVAALGDDGSLAVGSEGGVRLFGPSGDAPYLTFLPSDAEAWCCRDLASADFTGDGVADVASVGPHERRGDDDNDGGWVVLVDGSASGVIDETGVFASIRDEDAEGDMFLGYGMVALGDTDGDGFEDLALPSHGASEYLAVFRGPLEGARLLSDADIQFHTYDDGVERGGDLDGDGLGDILLYDSASGERYGEDVIRALPGTAAGIVEPTNAFATLYADEPLSLPLMTGFGYHSFAGGADADSDGYDDVVLPAHCGDPDLGGPAHLWVAPGPLSGAVAYTPTVHRHVHSGAYNGLINPTYVDLDDDGAVEVVVHSPVEAPVGTRTYAVLPLGLFHVDR